MTPVQVIVQSYELAKAIRGMSNDPREGSAVLLGALAIVSGSTDEPDAEKAWAAFMSNEAKAMFIRIFNETKAHARVVQG